MSRFLLVYYDAFHTPLEIVQKKLPEDADVTVLVISLGTEKEKCPELPAECPSGWRISEIDGRRRFCEEAITPAIKANACYQDSYYLSAALSRPVLALICAEQAAGLGVDTLIHGFAGNDQFRFEMGISTLRPDLAITSIAKLCGSRNKANENSFTVSENLWGRSIEAGVLEDPWQSLDQKTCQDLDMPVDSNADPEFHTIRFEGGKAIALDDTKMPLEELIVKLDLLGRKYAVGLFDLVEDGYVGLKTRAIYESRAAYTLITAHRDLERLVLTRMQNLFKPLVDKAWAELVYDGYWFDPQREGLEAYIENINQWVTGEVKLEYKPGILSVVGRQSINSLYDQSQAIYRIGQDLAVGEISELAFLKSVQMRKAWHRNPKSQGAV